MNCRTKVWEHGDWRGQGQHCVYAGEGVYIDGRSRWMKGYWSGMSVIQIGQVNSENLAEQKCTGHLEVLVC